MTVQEIITIIDNAYFATASGTNTYTVTHAAGIPPLLSYTTGKHYYIKFTNGNTGAVTVNIDGIGAANVYKLTSQNLISGDILSGSIQILVYDGSNFQLLGGESLLSNINQKINSSASNFQQTII